MRRGGGGMPVKQRVLGALGLPAPVRHHASTPAVEQHVAFWLHANRSPCAQSTCKAHDIDERLPFSACSSQTTSLPCPLSHPALPSPPLPAARAAWPRAWWWSWPTEPWRSSLRYGIPLYGMGCTASHVPCAVGAGGRGPCAAAHVADRSHALVPGPRCALQATLVLAVCACTRYVSCYFPNLAVPWYRQAAWPQNAPIVPRCLGLFSRGVAASLCADGVRTGNTHGPTILGGPLSFLSPTPTPCSLLCHFQAGAPVLAVGCGPFPSSCPFHVPVPVSNSTIPHSPCAPPPPHLSTPTPGQRG